MIVNNLIKIMLMIVLILFTIYVLLNIVEKLVNFYHSKKMEKEIDKIILDKIRNVNTSCEIIEKNNIKKTSKKESEEK